jgi:hypothetical protein
MTDGIWVDLVGRKMIQNEKQQFRAGAFSSTLSPVRLKALLIGSVANMGLFYYSRKRQG